VGRSEAGSSALAIVYAGRCRELVARAKLEHRYRAAARIDLLIQDQRRLKTVGECTRSTEAELVAEVLRSADADCCERRALASANDVRANASVS
jgi:hypothetical protein